jgi:hypothetical protein
MTVARKMLEKSSLLCVLAMAITSISVTPAAFCAEENPLAPGGTGLNSISPEKNRVPTMNVSLTRLHALGEDLRQLLQSVDNLYALTGETFPSSVTNETDRKGRKTVLPQTARAGSSIRKEDITQDMNVIRTGVTSMKDKSDDITNGKLGFDCINELRVTIQPDLEEWRDAINDSAIGMDELEKLTQGPEYNNKSIATVAYRLRTDIKRVNAVRHRIYKAVKHCGKGY